jgi:hypothetical protein
MNILSWSSNKKGGVYSTGAAFVTVCCWLYYNPPYLYMSILCRIVDAALSYWFPVTTGKKANQK